MFVYVCLRVFACSYTCIPFRVPGTHLDQKRKSDSWKLQRILSYPAWVLETELESSARANALNY